MLSQTGYNLGELGGDALDSPPIILLGYIFPAVLSQKKQVNVKRAVEDFKWCQLFRDVVFKHTSVRVDR